MPPSMRTDAAALGAAGEGRAGNRSASAKMGLHRFDRAPPQGASALHNDLPTGDCDYGHVGS